MQLWLLRPVDSDPAWKPWYDKAFGFVVRAATEEDARKLAADDAGDEGREPWLKATSSTCAPLDHRGPAMVVIRDFAGA